MINKSYNDVIAQNEKNEARRQIKEKIQKIKAKKRIHIDKKELEYLLFDIVKLNYSIGNIKKEEKAKFLVWSGPFLSKIDLSEIDFSNVVWNINYTNNDERYYLDNGITEINLSNTNAKIDFSKGQGFDDSYPRISGCNFEGTDLSKSFDNLNKKLLRYHLNIDNCNFKNTKLKLNFSNIFKAYSNDFSNNDFSLISIEKDFIMECPNNNFSYTEITIHDIFENKQDLYDEMYRKGNFKDCYYNGEAIDSTIYLYQEQIKLFLESIGKIDQEIKEERKRIENELLNRKAKGRVHIDKDKLEKLLFETKELYVENMDKTIKVKFLVWSGPFLSKIDLSEINFDNVEWQVYYDTDLYKEKIIENTNSFYLEKYEDKTKDHIIGVYKLNNIHKIDLSNTNAKIDFSKSISNIIYGRTIIDNCNFEGTDLSNNELGECYIGDSNLSNTGIKISNDRWLELSENYDRYFYIQRSNLSNNNLKNPYQIGSYAFEEHIYKSNLDNTGLNILVNKEETIEEVIGNNSVNGCLINGQTRESYERTLKLKELREKKEELEEELECTYQSERNLIKQIYSINEQIKNL